MMKRTTHLIAVALLGTVNAFAQAPDAGPTPQFSGYINTGLVVDKNSDGTFWGSYANDYPAAGPVASVTISLAGSNYGYSITPLYLAGTATFDSAYAWVNPTTGLTLEAGYGGNENPFLDLDDYLYKGFSTTGMGAWYSLNGFTVGGLLNPQTTVGEKAINALVGLRYSMEKNFTINVYSTNSMLDKLDQLYATFSVDSVSNLTLNGGYIVTGGLIDGSRADFVDLTLGYQMSQSFYAGVVVYDRNLSSGTTFVNYKPNVAYIVTPTVTLSAYFLGSTVSSPNYEPQAMVTWTPVTGSTIRASIWYDTNPNGSDYFNSNVAVMSPAASTAATVSADIDFVYSF